MDHITELNKAKIRAKARYDFAYAEWKKAVIDAAELKVGDIVLYEGNRFQIARVYLGFGDSISYVGTRFKKDGSLGVRTQQLYSYSHDPFTVLTRITE
jgi:hypothetical protein